LNFICGPEAAPEVGFAAHLFFVQMQTTSKIQDQIEDRLSAAEPDVEVLLAEEVGPERVRVFIDHPEGVDLALCERVTGHLRELLEDYALEVSSPGPERPLAKREHFRRFVGRRIRVRTRQPVEGSRSFSGELVEAADDAVSLAADAGIVRIPYADIHKSNLLEG
jgi:ribosome maturation factor RimP